MFDCQGFDVFGMSPQRRIRANARARARMSLPPDWFRIASDQEELLSTWWKIMMYLLPRLDTAGISPV
jgi:hypothetical protein